MAKDRPTEGRHSEQAQADGEMRPDELSPIDNWLGRGLHRLYDDALREPLPNSLLKLLDELRDREGRKS